VSTEITAIAEMPITEVEIADSDTTMIAPKRRNRYFLAIFNESAEDFYAAYANEEPADFSSMHKIGPNESWVFQKTLPLAPVWVRQESGGNVNIKYSEVGS
jgi:hypothetical protein